MCLGKMIKDDKLLCEYGLYTIPARASIHGTLPFENNNEYLT